IEAVSRWAGVVSWTICLCAAGIACRPRLRPGGGRLMTELQYSTGSFRVSRARAAHSPQQRVFGIAFAIAMEVGIVYALLVTLDVVEAPKLPTVLKIVNVAPLPKDNDPPPPPLPIFEPPQAVVIEPVVTLIYDPPTPTTSISVPPP